MPGPSDLEQYYLELINEARLDPMRSAARYITSYSPLTSSDSDIQSALTYFGVSGSALLSAYKGLIPVAPVAWNENLATAARQHNAAMIAADQQSHQLPGEASLGQRAQNAGYTGWTRLGENVYAFAENALYGHAGFMVDWGYGPDGMQSPAGHRDSIMNVNLTEVGIGVTAETNPATSVGPQVVTQDFGTRGHAFVLGVAYTDSDGDGFYTPGEGRANLVVSASGKTATSTTSGGYTLDLGTANLSSLLVSFSGGGLAQTATMLFEALTANIKIDIVNGDTLRTSGSGTVSGIDRIEVLGAQGISLITSSGRQTLTGNTGNDGLNGGAGIDTVVYSGNRNDYKLTWLSGGRVEIADERYGRPDGIDTLTSIERLQFADGLLQLQTRGDLNGDGTADLLFRAADGALRSAFITNAQIVDGGNYTAGDPGGTVVAFGVFSLAENPDGRSEPLLRARDGHLFFQSSSKAIAVYQTNLGVGQAFIAATDLDGDGNSDLLFTDAAGNYTIWSEDLNTHTHLTTFSGPGAGWALRATADFDSDGREDLLFQNAAGSYALWQMNANTVVGGGAIGNPGAGWFYKGTGDFNGDGKADILFQNVSGRYAIWDMAGTAVIGGGDIGTPGDGWTLAAIGDYNGDGNSDLLFRSMGGEFATWLMNNTALIGGGSLGNPGAGYTLLTPPAPAGFASLVFADAGGTIANWTIGGNALVAGGTIGNAGASVTALGTADLAGTGETDVLFRATDGTLAVWRTQGSAIVGTAVIGNPGAGWSYAAAADFNGDGRDDLLLHNSATGVYATWDMAGTAIIGGGAIGVAAGFGFVAAGDIDGDSRADLIFRENGTGTYFAWLMHDTAIAGGGTIGNPGGTWQFAGLGDFDGDGKSDLLFRDASGMYAEWRLDGTQIAGGGAIGNPGGTWQFATIADVNQDGRDDLVFVDAGGTYATWLLSGNVILGGATLGTAGAGYHLV